MSTGADEQVAAPSVEGATSSSPSVVVVVSTALVVPLPVSTGAPYSNGTDAGSSKKPCSSVYPSSGFISKAKATGTAPIESATASGW
jgi:hypothetical protein